MSAPKLRFEKFKVEWENVSFKEITIINQGLQIPISDRFLEEGGGRYFYITNEFLKASSNKKYYIENPPSSVVCNNEDILMTRTGNTGKVVTNVSGAFHNNFFRIKYDKSQINRDFLYNLLNTRNIQNKILTLAGQSTIPDLNHSDFYKIRTFIPSIKEQELIGNFLTILDLKIQRQQEKVELLKEQKKGLMQKILTHGFGHTKFKKSPYGNIPAEWDILKLGKIFKLSSGNNLSAKNAIQGIYPVYGGNGISGYHNEYMYDEPQLVIGRVGALCGNINYTKGKVWITDNALLVSKKIIEYETLFMYYLLTSLELNNYANKTAQPVISGQIIYSIDVALPPIEEQQKITGFLSSLDYKIKLEAEKLKLLQHQKKAFMQQMFI